MYISKIEIDHFGKWEHETFTFHPNLQVVQGLNESGKTTLRRFIEQMLFDFKQKKNGVYPYQPLHTNTRGGRMWIEDEGLGALIIERSAVESQKKLVLRRAETGQELPETMLERVLHELTMTEYHSLFGFNEEELQNNAFESEEEIHRFLYSLSVMGHKGAYEESQKLLAEANKLFRPQAKKLELNERMDRLEGLTSQLAQTKGENALYEGYVSTIRELQKEEAELSEKLQDTESRLDVLENKLAHFDALEEFRAMEGLKEFPKEYDHSKAVEANNTLRAFEKELERTKIELEQAKEEREVLGEVAEDSTLESLYAKAQAAAAVEERAFELERELKTHAGNIGVQKEYAKPFTDAELAELDALQGEKEHAGQFQVGLLIGFIGIITIIVVGFLTNQVLLGVGVAAVLGIGGGFFMQKNGKFLAPKTNAVEEQVQQLLSGKGIEVTLDEARRFVRRNEGRSVNDFLQKKAQFVQLEQRIVAFKEESKDFWTKEQIAPPATVEQQLRIIRETWMASQKRVAKLEQLQESLLKIERHLAQLEQDTIEVRKELQSAISPLGITSQKSLELSYLH